MDQGISRRRASKILLASGLALAGGVGEALGQPANRGPANAPKPKPPTDKVPVAAAAAGSFLEGALKPGKTHDWILKPTVHVQAYQQDTATATKDKALVIGSIAFNTAAVVFPVIRGTASSETKVDAVKSELTFNDRPEQVVAQYNESYHSGVRLGRWEMRDKSGKEVELKLEIPMTCWETVFDEKLAAKATWPKSAPTAANASAPAALQWSALAKSTLGKQAMIDQDPDGGGASATALANLVTKWTEGKSPQMVSPLILAKTLAAKVLQTFQPSGSGEDYDHHGAFTGLRLQTPAETIQAGRGSPHDIASVLLGVYRTAGLPSRLVIGWDEADRKGDDANPLKRNKGGGGVQLRTWVEFCLFDEPNQKEIWVPVDVVRMRKRSSQPGKLDQPWKYFGSHDELDSVLPFAHHYLPPTTVFSYGYAFWGWFTTPVSQIGEHWLRFTTQTAPVRPKPRDSDDKKFGK